MNTFSQNKWSSAGMIIGGIRKESTWRVSGAMLFGGSTIALYAILLYVALICAVLLIFLVVSWFAGPPV